MKNFFTSIAFFVFFIINAQEKQNYSYYNTPLATVIEDIEKKHKLIFSFANDIIKGKVVTITNKEKIGLDELLYILETETDLSFKKISDSQIIITQLDDFLSNQVLNEIVIPGYITTGIDRKKDGSIDVTRNSLGILPGLVTPDILQSIQLVPGISTLDESVTGIQIRGGSPDQNLILFDDIKLYNSGYFYGMFSAFNPYATEKVNLFKSGTSAAYGDRISGIIDISTGEKILEKTKGGFGIDGLSVDGYIKTPLSNKLAVYVFARRSYTDVIKSPTYDDYAEKIFKNGGIIKDANGNVLLVENDDEFDVNSSKNTFSFYDLNAKVIFSPTEKDKFILSSLFTRNFLDFSFTNDGETKIDDLVTKNNGISLKWQRINSDARKDEVVAYLSNYKSHYLNNEVVDNAIEETNLRLNTITDFGFNLSSNRKINKQLSFKFGYQISNNKVSIDIAKTEPLSPEENENILNKDTNLKNALFGQFTYKANNTAFVGAGLRLVHYGSVGEAFIEPRLNVEYPITKQLRIKGSFERRNQPISQLIEFNQTELRLENNLWRLSDNNTYPLLQSNQVSGGLLFHEEGWTIDLDTYLKKLSGLTTFTNGFSTPQLDLSEGKSTIKGIDVLIKKRINNYRVWAGYTYNNITFNFSNIQTEKFPGNNDITHSFRISNSIKLNHVQLSLGWQYRTGKPFTPIANFNSTNSIVTFGDINSDRLEDYHRLDASAIYNFSIKNKGNWKGQLGASVLNLYNRKKPISIIYRTEEESNGLELKQVIQRYSLGFTPNLSFRIFF